MPVITNFLKFSFNRPAALLPPVPAVPNGIPSLVGDAEEIVVDPWILRAKGGRELVLKLEADVAMVESEVEMALGMFDAGATLPEYSVAGKICEFSISSLGCCMMRRWKASKSGP